MRTFRETIHREMEKSEVIYKQQNLFYLQQAINNDDFMICGFFNVNWALMFSVNKTNYEIRC